MTAQTHYNVIDEKCQHAGGAGGDGRPLVSQHLGRLQIAVPGHLLYLSQLPITANFMAGQPVSCSIAIAVNCLDAFFLSTLVW